MKATIGARIRGPRPKRAQTTAPIHLRPRLRAMVCHARSGAKPRPGVAIPARAADDPPMTTPLPGPESSRVPDPGTRSAAFLAWVLGLGLFLAVATLQALNAAASSAPPTTPTEAVAETAEPAIPAPGPDPFTLSSMMRVGMGDRGAFGPPPLDAASSATELVRAAVVEYALQTPMDSNNSVDPFALARGRLDEALAAEGASDATAEALRADLRDFERLTTPDHDSIDQDRRDELDARHGWFARLAFTARLDPDDPARRAVVQRGQTLFFGVGGAVLAGLAAFGTGLVLFIVVLVKLSNRTLRGRLDRPAPGGSVYLEIFPLFVGAFLLHSAIAAPLVAQLAGPSVGIWFGILGQWAIALVLLWPMVRGVPLARARRDLGFHRGEGFIREIFAGFVGYLAGLPLLAAGFGLTILLVWLQGRATGSAPEPNNPLVELAGSGSLLLVVAVGMLATLWAPLVEESVFRGGVYRHLRGRVGFLIAALLTAIFFAFMHGYGPAFTPPLIALAITFAALREWRGSIIAAMTAHFIHNAALISFILMLSTLTG